MKPNAIQPRRVFGNGDDIQLCGLCDYAAAETPS
jgi:hypothetical protein